MKARCTPACRLALCLGVVLLATAAPAMAQTGFYAPLAPPTAPEPPSTAAMPPAPPMPQPRLFFDQPRGPSPSYPAQSVPAPIDQQKVEAFRNDLEIQRRALEIQGIGPADERSRAVQGSLNQLNGR